MAKVKFEMSPEMAAEVGRILAVTSLGSTPDVFRRAFTLLRIHVEAAEQGRELYMVDPERPAEKVAITLPFNVKKQKGRRNRHP